MLLRLPDTSSVSRCGLCCLGSGEVITHGLILPRFHPGSESSVSPLSATAPSMEICPPNIYATHPSEQKNSTERNVSVPLPYGVQPHVIRSFKMVLRREHFFLNNGRGSWFCHGRWLGQRQKPGWEWMAADCSSGSAASPLDGN